MLPIVSINAKSVETYQSKLSCKTLSIVQGIYGIMGLFSDAGKIFIGVALKRNSATTKVLVSKNVAI